MKYVDLKSNEAFLVTDRLIRNYFTGIDIAEGYLVLSKNTAYFTDARYFSAAKVKIEPLNIAPVLYNGLDSIKEYLNKNQINVVYIDYERTTLSEYETYKALGVELKDGTALLRDARAIKSQEEIDNISKACEIIQKVYHTAIKTVKKGMTEVELRDTIESLMVEYGASGPSFESIVAFGANGAVPHHETGDTVLEDDTSILVDIGCKYNGYCSDITRMAFFGTPDKKFLDAYDAVLTANKKAIELGKSGMKTDELDKIARDVLTERGYGEYFTHSLGHGVGLEIHEFPWVAPKRSAELKDGMVFTDEPGVYFDGEFGIRIEDTIMLKDGKIVRLYDDDKELIIIKK